MVRRRSVCVEGGSEGVPGATLVGFLPCSAGAAARYRAKAELTGLCIRCIVVFSELKKFPHVDSRKIFLTKGFVLENPSKFSSPPFGRRFFLMFSSIFGSKKFHKNLKISRHVDRNKKL